MKSLAERIADRKRRNEENAAEENTSPKEVAETGEKTGKKGKAAKDAKAAKGWGGKNTLADGGDQSGDEGEE